MWTSLRYGAILLVITIVLAMVLLYLDRIRSRPLGDEAEEESGEKITLGGSALQRGINRLGKMVINLVRRFGLSGELLAAISVENIYANLCRLARRSAHPHHRRLYEGTLRRSGGERL